MDRINRRYFPNLDALRFFAFIHVFISHALPASDDPQSLSYLLKSYLAPGFFGIDFFFVLSGFLITWTLLEESASRITISFRNFFARRSLRIWPLYFLFVLFGFLAFWLGRKAGYSIDPLPPIHYFASFILNFYIASIGPGFLFFLVFLWSISVEEQFYVLWGLIFKVGKRLLLHACIILILVSVWFRFNHIHDDNSLVFHSLSVAGNFAAGALLAWSCFYKSTFYTTLTSLREGTWTRIYLLFFVCFLLYGKLFRAEMAIVLEKLIFSLFYMLILFHQCFYTRRSFNAGSKESLRYLGKISYGLYCFHGLILTFAVLAREQLPFMNQPVSMFLFIPLVSLALTVLLAHLSYKYFETAFLRLKKKYY